jgi:hypothetical protein
MRCSGANYTRICRQRETCQLYRAFLNTHPNAPVEIHSMPVSASEGCYMFIPIKEVGL